MSFVVLGLSILLLLPRSPWAAETINVVLAHKQITSNNDTVRPGDFLNICSRDNEFHQPYSVNPPNKFGSPNAKEKDLLERDNCRIVKIKNNQEQIVKMQIYDRFHPQAVLVLNVLPKEQPKNLLGIKKAGKDTFFTPTIDEYPVAWCYTRGKDCGEKSANAWCNSRGFPDAKTWEINPGMENPTLVTRFIGNGQLCRGSSCDSFRSITCQAKY